MRTSRLKKKALSLLLILSLLIPSGRVHSDTAGAVMSGGMAVGAAIAASATASVTTMTIVATTDGVVMTASKKACSGGLSAAMCVIAVLSAAQMVINLVNRDKSKDIQNQAQCTGAFCTNNYGGPNPNITPPPGGIVPPGPEYGGDNTQTPTGGATVSENSLGGPNGSAADGGFGREARQNLKELAKLGYEVDLKTGLVKTPKGTFPAEQLSTAEGMTDAGFDANEVAKAFDLKDKVAKEALKKLASIDEQGGGGGRRAGGNGESGKAGFDMAKYLASLNKKDRGPASTNVAGMAVSFGGESIGVKSDNLFEMISRRYRHHRHEFVP